MSILLEALRKSEKNQHLRETPTIHSDDQSGPVSEPLHRGPLLALLVIAVFACGWFVWHQYQAPDEGYQPPVTLAANKGDIESKPREADKQLDQVAVPASSAVETVRQKRTPVESYQAPANEGSEQQAAVSRPAMIDAVAGTPQAQPSGSEQKLNTSADEAISTAPVATQPTKPAAESYHPGEPAPIGYWELPDSVRSDVPEFKFSVLVFAKNPADRFVLTNGQRLEEGDSPQSGLVVEEIRRDGVIFSYRLYRFLVER
jgi:general secretion pathway protein B